LRSQVAASATDLEAARFLAQDEAGKRELRDVLEKRFKGHPERTGLLQALGSPAERRQLSGHSFRSVRIVGTIMPNRVRG